MIHGIDDQLALIACAEAEYRAADRACRLWQEACGPGIWREGHPLDRDKLRRRRLAKRLVQVQRFLLGEALACAPIAGSG